MCRVPEKVLLRSTRCARPTLHLQERLEESERSSFRLRFPRRFVYPLFKRGALLFLPVYRSAYARNRLEDNLDKPPDSRAN